MDNIKKQRLFVDMDGTLARFHDQVNYLERMFEENFFRDLEPFENMVAGIRQFIQDHPEVEVFVLSARVNGEPPYCEAEKNAWMDRYLPEIDQTHRIYTEVGKSKADYIPGGVTKDDFLLDDYNKGLNLWLYDGGSAIKCHNNINQRGLGAYGGSAGMLWTGPMVHTDDTPALISAELSQHMGLSYDLEKVIVSSKGGIKFSVFKPGSRLDPNPFTAGVSGYLRKVLEDPGFHPERYEAVCTDPHYVKRDFMNPLNAIRWLEGNALGFNEIQLRCNDGTKLSLPYFQANALATNLYDCTIQDLLIKTNQSPDVGDSFRLALEEASLPVVGQVHYLGSNGIVGETGIFHTVEEMKEEIRASEDCGRPITVNWFVHPKPPKEVTLYCSPDLGAPEVFTISPDNLRKAAEVCGFQIGNIEEFLSEYTWDESSMIWNEYAQFIDKLANIMDGFASREEMEAEFYECVSEFGDAPEEVAGNITRSIENWARWHNEEAKNAGIIDKAIGLQQWLYNRQSAPVKQERSSLDDMISSAKGKQSEPGSGFASSPER